jgi:predicted protein tyrosine phosphatase
VKLTILGIGEAIRADLSDVTHILSVMPELEDDFLRGCGCRQLWRRWPAAKVLHLPCDDMTVPITGHSAPTARQVREAIAFGLSVPTGGHLLVHCAAGVSRSAAMACAILAARMGDAQKAVKEVFRVRPQARPNKRIIQLADEYLELDRQLTDEVEKQQRLAPFWFHRKAADHT